MVAITYNFPGDRLLEIGIYDPAGRCLWLSRQESRLCGGSYGTIMWNSAAMSGNTRAPKGTCIIRARTVSRTAASTVVLHD
jgi:hypothetical protein